MKTHKHHIHYKSQGGSDDPSNLVEIDFVEHARLHAVDFLNGGPHFDCRQEGWPYLEEELKEKVRAEIGRRCSLRNTISNPMWNEETKEKMRKSLQTLNQGEANPFYGKKHTPETREKMKKARKTLYPERRALPIILIHPDGKEEEFISAIEACKKYDLSPGNLSMVINGKAKQTKGFRAKRPSANRKDP